MKSQTEILIEKRENALKNAENNKNDIQKYNAFLKYADNLLLKINNPDEIDEQLEVYSEDSNDFNSNNINVSLSFTDTYTSKYRYGRLSPTNQCIGEKIYKRLEGNDWEKQNHESRISEMNDNRMDRYHGFNSSFKHKGLDIVVNVSSDVSATGKTKSYTFSSSNVESEVDLKKLLLE